jgi:hypothetical protein
MKTYLGQDLRRGIQVVERFHGRHKAAAGIAVRTEHDVPSAVDVHGGLRPAFGNDRGVVSNVAAYWDRQWAAVLGTDEGYRIFVEQSVGGFHCIENLWEEVRRYKVSESGVRTDLRNHRRPDDVRPSSATRRTINEAP